MAETPERREAEARVIAEGGWEDLPEAAPPDERQKPPARTEKAPDLGPVTLYGEALAEYVLEEQRGEEGALTTGWPSIDGGLGKRMRPGELVLAAARTGIGKTWIVQRLTERKLRLDPATGGVDFTLEMPSYQMAERFTAGALGISPRTVSQRAERDQLDADKIMREQEYLRRLAFYESTTTIELIPLVVARARERLGRQVGIIIVDYSQLLGWQGRQAASLYEQASANMRRLKDVAKAERAVIIAAAQLSRGGGGAGEQEPTMAALRDSGAAEEAADRILMFWRDRPKMDEDTGRPIVPDYQEIRCKLEKNRHGPRGARCLLRYTESMGLEEQDEYQDENADQVQLQPSGFGSDLPF